MEGAMGERTNLDGGEILAALDALREQATAGAQRIARELELERRMRENPMGTLAVAAGAGFVLGGGLWPVLRPFARAAFRTILAPQNLLAIAAAAGAMKAASSEEDEEGAATPATPGGEGTAH
jgi:hypothetical protein